MTKFENLGLFSDRLRVITEHTYDKAKLMKKALNRMGVEVCSHASRQLLVFSAPFSDRLRQ